MRVGLYALAEFLFTEILAADVGLGLCSVNLFRIVFYL